jgi:hypothetical protein
MHFRFTVRFSTRFAVRNVARYAFIVVISCLALYGCTPATTENLETTPPGTVKETKDRSAGAFADLDPWVLKTTDPVAARGNHGIFLGNGYIGVTPGSAGGADKDARFFVAGVYDEKENLKALPDAPYLSLPQQTSATPYSQTLNLRTGILQTKQAFYQAESFVSATNPYLWVQHLTGSGDKEDKKIGASEAPRVTKTQANGVTVAVAVAQQRPVGIDNLTRYVAVYTSRDGGDPSAKALAEVKRAMTAGYESVREAQEAEWKKRWASADIQIEGDPEAQQLIHKLMFDLLQSTRIGGDDSIAPETLSGEFYKGHIFWDAEIWMFPALLAQHPDLARTILDYRFKYLSQAQEQAKAQSGAGADFPWESAASGKEVAPGGFSKGRHVTAGVGWAVWQYYLATNDKKWLTERGLPLLSNIADYFVRRATKNPATGEYEIKGVFGPDENKGECDNNTYTNAMAKNVLTYATNAADIVGKSANPQWKAVADKLKLPFDKAKGYYLARDADKGEKTKQADGELLLWPAKLAMDAKTAAATFDFHKERPIKNGPAMTDSIHALIAARLGRADEAEKDFRESYRPFVRGPFLLFSEKRSLDRCVFTTGAGGILQSVLYGFGGLDFSEPGGLIKAPVALPPSWKKLTITGIEWKGKRYTLTVTPEGRTLK